MVPVHAWHLDSSNPCWNDEVVARLYHSKFSCYRNCLYPHSCYPTDNVGIGLAVVGVYSQFQPLIRRHMQHLVNIVMLQERFAASSVRFVASPRVYVLLMLLIFQRILRG